MENNEQKLDIIINEWQEKTYKLRKSAFIISGILIAIFFASVVAVVIMQFVSGNTDWKTSAEICNTFTGIVLGFVAMAVSVISIVLGFYNTIQAEKSNIDSIKQFHKIISNNESLGKTLNDVSKSLSDDMDKLTELIQKQSEFEELLTTISEEVKEIKRENHPSAVTSVEPAPQALDDVGN